MLSKTDPTRQRSLMLHVHCSWLVHFLTLSDLKKSKTRKPIRLISKMLNYYYEEANKEPLRAIFGSNLDVAVEYGMNIII